MTGVFRYIRWDDVAKRLDDGWRWVGVADPDWSALMWWCCGECQDEEIP